MKSLLLFVITGLLITLNSGIKGQQVISSSGISGSNGSGSLNSTVGELVIDTKTAGSTTLTQGFHQTKLTITAVRDLKGLDFNVTVSPNPTNDFVLIKTNSTNLSQLSYFVYDANGKLLSTDVFKNTEISIPFGHLQPATYFIKIIRDKKEVKTLKVVKQ